MENLVLSFTVVFPLFVQLVLGYGLKRIKLLDDHTLGVCNKLVFRVFLPCLLFLNVYRADLAQVFNARLLAWAAAAILMSFCALMVLIPLFEKDPKKRGVLVQGIFRSNFALFGVPVAVSLFGQENSGVVSILTVVVIPMFNMLYVVALEVFRGGKPNAGRMLLGIAKNPLILSTLTGLLLLLLDVSLPRVLVDALDDISQVATPSGDGDRRSGTAGRGPRRIPASLRRSRVPGRGDGGRTGDAGLPHGSLLVPHGH